MAQGRSTHAISMMMWIRICRLSIKDSLFVLVRAREVFSPDGAILAMPRWCITQL